MLTLGLTDDRDDKENTLPGNQKQESEKYHTLPLKSSAYHPVCISQNAMHPVQTAGEKDLCLVLPVRLLMFLPRLVCAHLNAPLDTTLMKTKCVKVSKHLYIITYFKC